MASIINSDNGVISGTAGLKSTGANDGALNIQTNGTNAITVSSAQTVAINGNNISADNSLGFRNRIINGDMRIDQRNAGASVTPFNGQYLVDRWFGYQNNGSKYSAQQTTTAPTGFVNSLRATSLSAYSIVSTDVYTLGQAIEGLNVADLGWGTASAKTITLSFQVRSSLTGTFGGVLQNSAGNRSYPFTYTISSANTWEYETITIAGDTSGTWLTNNGVGVYVLFGLGVGTTYSGTAGSWSSSLFYGATGATSVVGTNGATFFITGVQFEVGSVATSFERRDYGRELIMCQRYYWQVSDVGGATTGCTIDGLYSNGSGAGIFYSFMHPVTMRTAPTATVNYNDLTNASSVVVTTSIYGANVSANGGTTSSGRTQFNFTSTGFVKMSAEL